MKKIIIVFSLIFCFTIFYKNEIKNYITQLYIKNQAIKILDEFKNFRQQSIEQSKKQIVDQYKQQFKQELNFIDVPKKNSSIDDSTIYNDVISRQSKPFGDQAGRHVNVHETAHGIHSDLRNEYQRKLGYKCNAFYCLKGRAVILREPNITIKDITKYIPDNLRSYRYNLYFVQQLKDWNDVPTYVFDEWNAYILGSECAVEDYQKNTENPKSDAVSGCLDFSIYSIATAMAVKELDPNYWNKCPEFKAFIKYNLERAEKTFKVGKEFFKSKGQDKLLNSFLKDSKSDNLKNFMKSEFGNYFLEI